MPARLPVAHVRPLWVRYGVTLPLLAVATLVTWAAPPILDRTPFMFFFGAVALAAYVGGIGPGVFATLATLAIVELVLKGPADAAALLNDLAFAAVSAVIIWLAHRTTRGMRRERAQREWCEVTLRSVGDAVIVTDAEGRVLTLNRAAEELTGWSESEALEQPIAKVFEIVNEDTRTPVESPVTRVCREGRVVGLANHTVLLARDGREIPIDDSGAPIWSEDGRVAGAVLVFRDIRDRREAERQRAALLEGERAARAEAQAANRAKDEFLAVLSHELRTPLNAVLGWSQVVRSGPLSAEATRGLEVIERNARRQARLIDDVLDVSRIVSGTLRLESAPIDLAQVVEAAADTVRPLIEAKGLVLEMHGESGGPVLGDAHRLQQVVWNLLSNAVKFTPSGGRIEVVTTREAPLCSVAVRDTGVGIAPEFLPHVFQQFRQEEAGSARRFGGLGIGLTIVRHLVEMHGGTVSATSAGRGCGATFTVRLPLSSESAAAAAAAGREREAARPSPRLAGVRVLAVDDEPDARGFTAEVLGRAGAEVRVAGSAAEALVMLKEFDAEVILADVEMPGGDGFELLRRAREAGIRAPAVAVTAHSSAADRMRVLAAGFRQHVSKPVEAAELLLVVASVVSRANDADGSRSSPQ